MSLTDIQNVLKWSIWLVAEKVELSVIRLSFELLLQCRSLGRFHSCKNNPQNNIPIIGGHLQPKYSTKVPLQYPPLLVYDNLFSSASVIISLKPPSWQPTVCCYSSCCCSVVLHCVSRLGLFSDAQHLRRLKAAQEIIALCTIPLFYFITFTAATRLYYLKFPLATGNLLSLRIIVSSSIGHLLRCRLPHAQSQQLVDLFCVAFWINVKFLQQKSTSY